MTDIELEEMLQADGWPLERLDENTWRSGFQHGGGDKVRFFVRLTKNWLYLTIIPFVTVPEDPAIELALFRRLLVLNREITLAKLALDRADVVLTVELATEKLAWSQIKDGLDALTFYTAKHQAELAKLTQSTN